MKTILMVSMSLLLAAHGPGIVCASTMCAYITFLSYTEMDMQQPHYSGPYFLELREDLKPTHRVSSMLFHNCIFFYHRDIYIRYISSPVWMSSTLATINNTGINIPLRAFGNRYGYVCKTNSYTQIPSPRRKCLES